MRLSKNPKQMQTSSIYLASPLGFSEEGRLYIKQVLLPKLSKLNLAILDPWAIICSMNNEQIASISNMLPKQAIKIGETNFDLIDKSDIVLANLNGTDPDSGTCIEIGYACKAGKLIIGYRTDFRLSGDTKYLHVNLQVETAIIKSGGKVFNTVDSAIDFLKLKITSQQ